MSSATSIERAAPRVREGETPPRDSFKPWHFFVLASLITATAAVLMTRQARPEHLVLISLTIGAAGFAAAALYRTLAPLVSGESAIAAEPLTESMRATLEREKHLALRAIKELEFDRAMGKVSQKDFDEMAGRLRTRAIVLMKQLDAEGAYRELIERELSGRLRKSAAASGGSRAAGSAPERRTNQPTTGRTCVCGTVNDADATFCKRCGTKLAIVGKP
jgi:hypothetical protein